MMGLDSEVTWNNFVEQSLKDWEKRPGFSLDYEKFGKVTPTAVTAVNEGLLQRALANGFPGIAVCVCDHSREAIAFAVSRAISNAVASKSEFDIRTGNLPEGAKILVDDAKVEYLGLEEREFNGKKTLYLRYRQPARKKREQGLTIALPLDSLPPIQLCTDEAKLDSYSKKRVVSKLGSDSNSCATARLLREKMSAVGQSVAFATSASPYANIPPTGLRRARIKFADEDVEHELDECLVIGHFSKGEVKQKKWTYLAGAPALLAVSRNSEAFSDLYDLCDYAEEGGEIESLVMEAPTAECIANQKENLREIIEELHLPVAIFCNENVARNTDAFQELNIPVFIWGRDQLKDMNRLCAGQELSLSPRERRVAEYTLRVYPALDEGAFSYVANCLYKMKSELRQLNEVEQIALLSLVKEFGRILRQTEVSEREYSEKSLLRIDHAMEVLVGGGGGYGLSNSQVLALREAVSVLRSLCTAGVVLPKEEVTFDVLSSALTRPNGHAYLVVANQDNKRMVHEYWSYELEDLGFDSERFHVVTVGELLKEKHSVGDEEVCLSGWFRRDDMERILMSGIARNYSVIAYRGVDATDLETQWLVKAEKYWRQSQKHRLSESVKSLAHLHIVIPTNEIKEDEEFSIQPDTSLPGVVRSFERDRDRSQQASSGEKACPGRCVWFTSGSSRWLRSLDSGGDRLPVVTNLLEDGGEVVRKDARSLQEGDLVLRSAIDVDVLDEACRDQGYGSYEEILATAKLWFAPIRQAKQSMSDRAIIRRIAGAGCDKTIATIRRWVCDDASIAPDSAEDIAVIGWAFGRTFSEEEIDTMMRAASSIRGTRITAGRQLSADIIAAFKKDAKELGDLEAAALGFGERHRDLGSVQLLCVEHIGEPVRVPIGKFGWFMD